MSNILVFAGTTEGRELAEILSASRVECDIFVATEYGGKLVNNLEGIKVHEGRIDVCEMRNIYKELNPRIVVDATHPYAEIVTDNIRKSLEGLDIKYLRLKRNEDDNLGESYKDISDCAKSLINTKGNILITTGSKELQEFTKYSELKERIFVRIIPGVESLNKCYEAGLSGKQIIAMQGPFSREMNEAIIKQYDIKHLVSKSSGKTGGMDTKIAACINTGIRMHIIDRPDKDEIGLSLSEIIKELELLTNIKLVTKKPLVSLVGIGPGNKDMMTLEATKAIEEADVIFGAKRMIDSIESQVEKYPYYLKKDILPVIDSLDKTQYRNIVILFSGDTGFFSGCESVYEELKNREEIETVIVPGISSISLLAARIGESWQDGSLISLHNNEESKVYTKFINLVLNTHKTFFITSGVKDINTIGEMLKEKKVNIKLGFRLSYEDEEIINATPEDCINLKKEGLYVGVVINDSVTDKIITPSITDEEFDREKVPMTKEEIRQLSVCKLKLKKDSVVYDIGSGSGSVAVQIAKMSADIKVYAIECKDEAYELTLRNAKKHEAYNINAIKALAPEGLKGLPSADAAFIGGSRGNLREIIIKLREINPKMRIVINAISMETICEMKEILEEIKVNDLSICQVAVSKVKSLGEYNLLQAGNPVFIYSFNLEV